MRAGRNQMSCSWMSCFTAQHWRNHPSLTSPLPLCHSLQCMDLSLALDSMLKLWVVSLWSFAWGGTVDSLHWGWCVSIPWCRYLFGFELDGFELVLLLGLERVKQFCSMHELPDCSVFHFIIS
jgi:hypothetical protein